MDVFLNRSRQVTGLLSSGGVIYHFDPLQNTWREQAVVRPAGHSSDSTKFFHTQSFRDTSLLLFTYQTANQTDLQFLVTSKTYNSILEIKPPKGYQPWMLFKEKTYFRTHDNRSLIDDQGRSIQYLPFEGHATILKGYHKPMDNDQYIILREARLNGSHCEIVELLPSGTNKSLFRFKSSSTPLNATIDSSGILWVASHSGLLRVDPGTFSCFDHHENMVPALHAINQDRDDKIWFGSYTDGFALYGGSAIQRASDPIFHRAQILPGSFIDEQKNMYFFDSEKGMLFQNNEKWQTTGRNRDRYGVHPIYARRATIFQNSGIIN